MGMFYRMDLQRKVDRGGIRSGFVRCYRVSLMNTSIRSKVQTDCCTVPGWLNKFSDMLLNPRKYLEEGACLLQELTGIPPDVLGDKIRARRMYAYETCISACCLCIRLCSVNGSPVPGVFPLEGKMPMSRDDHTLNDYVRPN